MTKILAYHTATVLVLAISLGLGSGTASAQALVPPDAEATTVLHINGGTNDLTRTTGDGLDIDAKYRGQSPAIVLLLVGFDDGYGSLLLDGAVPLINAKVVGQEAWSMSFTLPRLPEAAYCFQLGSLDGDGELVLSEAVTVKFTP